MEASGFLMMSMSYGLAGWNYLGGNGKDKVLVTMENSYKISCTFIHYLNAMVWHIADFTSQRESTFASTVLSTMALDY